MDREFSVDAFKKFLNDEMQKSVALINELADHDGMMGEIIAKAMLGESLAEKFLKTL
jgi:hypothetical protein